MLVIFLTRSSCSEILVELVNLFFNMVDFGDNGLDLVNLFDQGIQPLVVIIEHRLDVSLDALLVKLELTLAVVLNPLDYAQCLILQRVVFVIVRADHAGQVELLEPSGEDLLGSGLAHEDLGLVVVALGLRLNEAHVEHLVDDCN